MKESRYAVVTGSTKGIGRAIAEQFLKEGYAVICNYAHDDDAAGQFQRDNSVYLDRIHLIRQELSGYETVCTFAGKVKETCSSLDVLVCNSATTDVTPFGQITPDGWAKVMDTNLNAPFFLIQQLADMMAEQRGRILLIGSSMGQYPHARSVSYGVSKAALHAMTRYLIKYFSPKGITVNGIVPSFVDTPWQKAKEAEHRKRIEGKIALHRFAQPEEIAKMCMAVIHNQYINGSVLNIDGGYDYE